MITGAAQHILSVHPVRSFIAWLHGLALGLGGPGLFVRRVPRLLVPLAAADQRPPRRVDGDRAQGPGCCTTPSMATFGSVAGCYVIYYLAGEGRRGVPAEAAEAGPRRARAGAVSAARAAGADGAGAAAAAGAVQAVRAGGRRRERAAAAVRDRPSPWRAASATSRSASWRSTTAMRRSS